METSILKKKNKKPDSKKMKPINDDDEIYISLEDILQSEKDYKEGRYIEETAEEHFKRLGI